MYTNGLSTQIRHQAILEQLRRNGRVDVGLLADEFDTSPITVRRDLDQLAAGGVLRRVRGGAVSLMMRGEGLPFSMRAIEAADVKDRLAVAVGRLVSDGEALAIDSGTSGLAIARHLASRRLTVMPLSIQAIVAFAASSTVNLILPGGTARFGEGSIVGPLAEDSLHAFRFDTAVLTCCGISTSDGITAHDLQDASVKRAMIGSSRRTILVAESAKFARTAMAVVCSTSAIDVLVTDEDAPVEELALLRIAGIDVICV
jgi:DeoR/GlpR family transcriptional regulator of sugar metabolism